MGCSLFGEQVHNNTGQPGYSITQSSYTLDTWGLPTYLYYLFAIMASGYFPQTSIKVSCQVKQITDMVYAVVLFQCLSN